MNVSEAIAKRTSVRAFEGRAVPAATVREMLAVAHQAPSGGNLQPWRVHALAGAALEEVKTAAKRTLLSGTKEAEHDAYPANLWDPYRTRRYQNGEDLYRSIDIPREEKSARLIQLARNADLFGAPVGLFFSTDRRLNRAQWLDLGLFMENIMLLAVEHGLDTCAQGFWTRVGRTVGATLKLADDEVLVAGMALGWREVAHPINSFRSRRDSFEDFAELRGFEPHPREITPT